MGALLTHVFLYHWHDIKPVVLAFNPWNKHPLAVHDAVSPSSISLMTVR